MASRVSAIYLPLSCFFVLLLCLPPSVFAEEPNKVFIFRKLAVLDMDDATGKSYGEKIGIAVRDELEQMLRFDIITPQKVRVQYPLSPKSLGKISKKLQTDGFIAGRVSLSNKTINISLEILDRKGEMFALELIAMKEDASPTELEKGVRELVVRLIGRIPYKAVITMVENDVVTFDAGRVHGVEIGSKASLFEIIGVDRHPFTNEIISFSLEELGIIEVTHVEAQSAAGRIIGSKKEVRIHAGHKLDFIQSERLIRESQIEKTELLAAKKREPKLRQTEEHPLTRETPGRSRGSLAVSTGFLLNDYKINSNQFNFKRDTSPVSVVAAAGEYWVLAPIGVDVAYTASWIYFKQTGGVPKTDASLSWLEAHLKYRHFLSSSPLSPVIAGSVGYHIYDFDVDQSDLNFFNNVKYSGIDIGLSAIYPMTSKIKGILNVGYQPSLDVEEDPVTSGTDPNAYGYLIDLTGCFKVSDRTVLALGYSYQAYHINFSGTGTRGVGTTNAEIRDIYQGVNLNLVYEF